MLEYFIGALLVVSGIFYWLRLRRSQFYSDLQAGTVTDASMTPQPTFEHLTATPDFARRLVHLDDAVDRVTFEALTRQIQLLTDTERSYIPSHKKGGTIAYETLCTAAPLVTRFYQSPELSQLVSRLVGTKVVPTPLHDQSSCSVLCYERPGDHIGWHYDHNFYRGRHFTALIPITNRGKGPGQLSAAKLMAKVDDEELVIPTAPNALIVFEGARVIHKVTPIEEGERRVILSMTFTEDPSNMWYQGVARRIKDTAFFGIRALWT